MSINAPGSSPNTASPVSGFGFPSFKSMGSALALAGVLGCSRGADDQKNAVPNPAGKVPAVNAPANDVPAALDFQGQRKVTGWKDEWGKQEEGNPIFWWAIRQEEGVKIAARLQKQRAVLVGELAEDVDAGKVVRQSTAAAILDFNYEVTSGYLPDYYKMFGEERPQAMPPQVQFQRLPNIRPIELLRD